MWRIDEIPSVYLTALCAWREARGTSDEAIAGVLHVIRNRALQPKWWGSGYVGVILKPQQFSSFNPNDPNAVKIPDDTDHVFNKILNMTELVMMGQREDLTGGATHYHDTSVHPSWASHLKQTAKIGPFVFYK